MKTHELIEKLSQEAPLRQTSRTPAWWAVRLISVLILYGVGAQFFLGVRPDIILQFERPFFVLEIILLAGMPISAALASVFVMYPDMYQKPWILKIPYLLFAALILLLSYQFAFMAIDIRMVIPPPGGHAMECALCIGSVALIPSALIFGILRQGASVTPVNAGFLAVLATTGIGCLILRIAEANDSLMHLVSWHYLPTFIFASIGAALAKRLLKW